VGKGDALEEAANEVPGERNNRKALAQKGGRGGCWKGGKKLERVQRILGKRSFWNGSFTRRRREI